MNYCVFNYLNNNLSANTLGVFTQSANLLTFYSQNPVKWTYTCCYLGLELVHWESWNVFSADKGQLL